MLLRELVAQSLIVSVGPAVSVRVAADAMAAADASYAAVLDAKQLVGILTERDLVQRVLVKELNIDETRVSNVMTRKVIFGKAGDSISSAARLMNGHHIRHLPVVDKKGMLLGVVSIRELLREEIHGMHDYIDKAGG